MFQKYVWQDWDQAIPNYKNCQHAHVKTIAIEHLRKNTNTRIPRKKSVYIQSPDYNLRKKTKIKKPSKTVSKGGLKD